MKRPICPRCSRPSPAVCVCSALPESKIRLERCNVFVLQHPHEQRRQNRSLPFIEYCVDPANVHVVVTRRLKDTDDIYRRLNKPDNPLWLVYPSPDAMPLARALQQHGSDSTYQTNASESTPPARISLLFIDATWKFAREMIKASTFPSHMLCVQLDLDDLRDISPRRFDIRTPPSDQHLSTAECIALALARMEGDPGIYSTIMKPLDLMVHQWHQFTKESQKQKQRDHDGGAGDSLVSDDSPSFEDTVVC